MFILFVLSALVPVSVLTLMTYKQIGVLIDKQSTQFLHQSSKAIGLRLFEKLQNMATVTDRFNTLQITNESEQSTIQKKIQQDRLLDRLFSNISLHKKGKSWQLLGDKPDLPPLSISEHNRLSSGGHVLVSEINENGDREFYLIKQVNPGRQLLVTHISSSYLWDIDHFLPSDTEVCILDHLYKILFCTNNIKLIKDQTPAVLSAAQTHSSFDWDYGDMEYTAYVRPLFLKGAFQSPDWTIVLSTPKARILKPLKRFQNLFPPLIALSILLVGLLSSHQIRKSLIPLEKLKQGTQEISEGKFTANVEIHSGDEFEDLAQSFNKMAKKLDTQFKSLQIVAEIDRIMLSSLDANYIVETVMDRIKDITEADKSLIYRTSTQLNNEAAKISIYHASVALSTAETELLQRNPRYIFVRNTNEFPLFLKDLSYEGARCLVMLPIYLKNELHATAVVAYNEEVDFDQYDFQHARELSDRIAVALTNADWEDRVYRQTNYDSVTGLPNRKLLSDRLEQAMQRARRDHTQIAILLIDLDRFKAINDSLGQSSGDNILKLLGGRFQHCIRETDTLVRFGGDEFVVIMSDIPTSNNMVNIVNPLAKSLLNAVILPFKIGGHEINITASLGIALFPSDSRNAGDLLKYAESAMYHAKSMGKGGYLYYSKDIDATTLSQLVLENDLRHAFQKDELELYYQPQFELQTNTIVCAEVLVRWNHPKLGLLTPDKFLPLALNTGLMVPLGNWIVSKTIEQIHNRIQNNIPLIRVAINISAHHFNTGNLVEKIRQAMLEKQISSEILELEITEDTVMSDLDKTFNILQELKQLGIKLAIDDFGTGYSSLSYLTRFPIDYLKIDQSFVKELPHSNSVSSIVAATIAMAHSLNLKVIAEGVENKQQLEFLRNKNCDIVQGFLLSKPLPQDKLVRLLITKDRDDRTAAS